MFPTAAADYLEYERFYLVDAIKPFIEAGKLRAYSINSVNRYSLLNEQMPPHLKAELLTRYDRYITDEVLPLIRKDCGDGENRPLPPARVWARFFQPTLTSNIPICFAA
jgi:esterase/lipase superfamily enzyme